MWLYRLNIQLWISFSRLLSVLPCHIYIDKDRLKEEEGLLFVTLSPLLPLLYLSINRLLEYLVTDSMCT